LGRVSQALAADHFRQAEGWRRIAMRSDCCAHIFLKAITLAATVTSQRF